LPPIEELSRYADPTAGANAPAPGTDPTRPAETAPLRETPSPEQPPPQEQQQSQPQQQ
jgi:general secretion pathway protein D